MNTRVEELAKQFEEANASFIATIEKCGDDQWSMQCGAEERTIGVIADHVAGGHVSIAQWIASIAEGQPSSVSMDMIHEANARHAAERAGVTRDDVSAKLRANGEQAVQILRGLTDDELERSVPMAMMGGKEVSASQVAEMLLIGHVTNHMNDIRSTMGD